MDNIQLAESLAKIIKAAIDEREIPLLSQVDFAELFAFAKKHKLENLLYKPLVSNHLAENELKMLEKAYDFSVFLYATQDYYLELIRDEFEKRKIKYMLLKGSVLRNLYPSPAMRQSADIDILIDQTRAKEIKMIMEELGFETELFGTDQDVYTLNQLVNIEMHRSLLPEHSKWYSATQEIVERAVNIDECSLKMTDEDFYLFHIVHMAKHMVEGGTGLRSMLDTWVYLKENEKRMNADILAERFNKAGLTTFEKNIRALCESLFEEKERSELSNALLEYVASSGWNGTLKNKKASQASPQVKGNRLTYWLRYVFMSPQKLSKTFKVLNKHPYLVGFVWIYRLFMAFFVRKGAVKNFIHRYDGIEKDEIIGAKEFIQKIGL